MQKASLKLHRLLSERKVCTAEHSAILSLEISFQSGNQAVPEENPAGTVAFNLGWTCRDQASDFGDALWLTVSTLPDDMDSDQNKSRVTCDAPMSKRLLTKMQEMNIFEGNNAYPPRPSTMLDHPEISKVLPSLQCLCTDIKEHQTRDPTTKSVAASKTALIGLLEDSSSSKHLISWYDEEHPGNISISLQDVLSKAKTLLCGIPPTDKMQLARILSVGVLQLHPTPWLERGWPSKDIFFFGIKDLSKERLQAPHLYYRIAAPKGFSVQQQEPFSHADHAPNAILYSLGIILIELAFERPLSELQEQGDTHPGDSASVTLHINAMRIADVIGKKLSVRYEKVVKRCLRCSFETEHMRSKLDDLDLQKPFVKSVICELDTCFEVVSRL